MEVVLIGLVFAGALGLRFWAAKEYMAFYDAMPEDEQKAMVRRAMASGC